MLRHPHSLFLVVVVALAVLIFVNRPLARHAKIIPLFEYLCCRIESLLQIGATETRT